MLGWVMKVARKRQAYTEEQRAEIREALGKSANKMDCRRLLILQTAGDVARSQGEISREFGVGKSTVSHLMGDYQSKGLPGVLTHKEGGIAGF